MLNILILKLLITIAEWKKLKNKIKNLRKKVLGKLKKMQLIQLVNNFNHYSHYAILVRISIQTSQKIPNDIYSNLIIKIQHDH